MTIALTQNQVAGANLSTPMNREIASVGPIGIEDDRLAPARGVLLALQIGFGFWAMVAFAALELFIF